MAPKKSKRTVVGASFHDDIADLDRQRAKLGLSRGEALKLIWERFGDEAVDAAQQSKARIAAIEEEIAPLVEALDRATAAWRERAHQRQMIGGLLNQVSRFANVQRLRLREGEVAAEDLHDELHDLIYAVRGIERRLDVQASIELTDDQVLADARALIERMRAGT
ncbi:hypothetical protein [Rothia halotolerans]|uniref:hypothetical protein n=1 Tax=Rothia halotolerans TaxID=405770 RepID=UPI0013EBECCC|nr:hypothetical protein [Rothia halotolerans]